jgi:Ca2+-binding RTX toxin-like protein
MTLRIGNLFARKSKSGGPKRRRRELAHRPLGVESLEQRQLLTVVSLTPVKDNSLIEYRAPQYSGGADPTLYVGFDHWASTRMRALMAFDVAGKIPTGAKINSVTLTVWVNLTASTTAGTPSVELHKTLANWGEGTSAPTRFMPPFGPTTTGDATWLNTFYNTGTWTTAGGDFSSTVSGVTTLGADGTSATWTSTAQMVADVQSWLDNPGTNFGWLLKGDETQESGKMIDSREATNVAHRPTLTIDYTVAAPLPTLAIAATSASKAEGNTGTTAFTFTVTRTGNTTGTSSVNYAVTGSAVNGANAADFGGALPSGTVNFAANETSKVVTINVTGDTTVEPDEGFTVTLSAPVGATIATATATGTIRNDDSGTQAVTLLPDGTLSVVGSDTVHDTISFSVDSRGRISVTVNGTAFGPFAGVARIVAHGGGGNDRITVSDAVPVAATLYGDDGNDSLYGGGNDVLFGGAGADSLRSGRGNAVLVGGAGNDRLQAGAGRNLLIGGDGQDSLWGDSGQNILIGGRTTYDNNPAALAAIMAEWTSSRSFEQRRENLSEGVSSPAAGRVRLKRGSTVLPNTTAAQDAFYGSLGNNWVVDRPDDDSDDSDDSDEIDDHGSRDD